jgi:hypothetical protein
LTVPPVVVLDACVLYPAAQRDLFMWLAAGGAIHAHWTNEIHDEWIRNVEHDYGVDRSVLDRVRKLMDRREMAKAGVVAENPDVFLCRLLADSPESAVTAFIRMRDNLRNPPKTTRECADTLAAQGLKEFAGLIMARLE